MLALDLDYIPAGGANDVLRQSTVWAVGTASIQLESIPRRCRICACCCRWTNPLAGSAVAGA
ncbi:hypothetical protein ACS3UN_07305 [Oscillospiraceae bacterium LTW-04]|nr:hypothetical protein RBH76_03040 [Oscillospiraceae bacterium MB24-C1]